MLSECPEIVEHMTAAELAVLSSDLEISLRDDQVFSKHAWQSAGTICGRGWGKTHATVAEVQTQVVDGSARMIGLMGPTDERTKQGMVDKLIELAPWYDRPKYSNNEVIWSNGAKAHCFTAENPKGPRGDNLDLVWCTELVAWPSTTRREAWDTLTTATRNRGSRRILWDTTSLGKNDLIIDRLAEHEADPLSYVLTRGTIFDNPLFAEEYLSAEMRKYPRGRRRDEELLGLVFTEAAGALWQETWIDLNRRPLAPPTYSSKLVSIDPTTTHGKDSDFCGFIVGQITGRDIFVTKDLSDRYTAEGWADRALDECEQGAAGIVIEVTGNSGGHYLIPNIRGRALLRGIDVREWPVSNGKPMPSRTPGVVYVREMKSRDAKETRAYAPAGLTEAGLVHMVGSFAELEAEMTTWVPGDRKSPNRLDALVYLVLELSGLERQIRPDGAKTAAATAKAADKLRGLLSRTGHRRV
jgi:phage terminase large subunit-like protein